MDAARPSPKSRAKPPSAESIEEIVRLLMPTLSLPSTFLHSFSRLMTTLRLIQLRYRALFTKRAIFLTLSRMTFAFSTAVRARNHQHPQY